MTPSKDTLEAANPASETAVAQSNTSVRQDSSPMRSDAVSLELPVKVHGTRVKDVVLGTTPHTEPFEEQTSSMIVFPQGGVLKMATPVASGQMMVVTNLKTGHDAICRVVQVRAFGHGQSYVEIEFTHRQAGYWGVSFASDKNATSSAIPPAPIAQPVSLDVKIEKPEDKPAPPISWAPAASLKSPAGKPPAQVGQKESAFAPIGSQEEVQPAAAPTSRLSSSSGRDTDRKGVVAEVARKSLLADLPPAPPVTPAASVSMADLQGDSHAASGISFAGVPGEAIDESPAVISQAVDTTSAPFGRLAASAGLSATHAAREPFGSLSVGAMPSETGKQRNWLAIAAGVVALLAVGAGATYFLHLPPFGAKSNRTSASVTEPAAPPVQATAQTAREAVAPVNAAPTGAVPPAVASEPVVVAAPAVTARTAESAPSAAKSAKQSQPVPGAAAASVEEKPAAKAPATLSAMNAHPTARKHAGDLGDADSAPALDGVNTRTAELPSLGDSIAPPAPEAPQGPVRIRVGGALKPPQLISSILPVYPTMARETGIEGDVVVDTTIDASGKVTAMKVLSGPPVLRQSALDALRQWKYAPSMLNGQPIPVQITVTIKFHRQ